MLHYNLDVATTIRYLGNNYTGEYRNVKDTVRILKESKCDDKIIKELKNILTKGCPNKFVTHTSRKNFLKFLRYGNHKSIEKKFEENYEDNE
jgi:hypothetical protein